MPEQTNLVAITTIASMPIAIETTPGLVALDTGSSELEMIGAKESLAEHIGDLTALIKTTAAGLVNSIEDLELKMRPKKVEAEFSVGFSVEAGFWYISKGSATGALKVKLEWQPSTT